jgi:hypothetical protein
MRFFIGIALGFGFGFFIATKLPTAFKRYVVKKISEVGGGVFVEEYLAYDNVSSSFLFTSDIEQATSFSSASAKQAVSLIERASSPMRLIVEEIETTPSI